MRLPFWTDQAWDRAVGPLWPPLSLEDGRDRDLVLRTLIPHWAARVQAVRSPVLGTGARDHFVAMAERSREFSASAGFDAVARAADGDELAFWFLDLGSAAWAVTLRRWTNQLVADAAPEAPLAVELLHVWEQQGADALLAATEPDAEADGRTASVRGLFRTPIELWQQRSPALASRSLDTALGRLDAFRRTERPLVALTYALTHGVRGDLRSAATLLETELSKESLPGRADSEVRYHLARYRWALGQDAEAVDALHTAIIAEPEYLIRIATDFAFGTEMTDLAPIVESVTRTADTLRSDLFQWQRALSDAAREGLAPPEDQDPFAEARRLLGWSAGDLYTLFAAARARGRARSEGAKDVFVPPPRFSLDLGLLRDFRDSAPLALPMRPGRDGRALFERYGEPGLIDDLLLEARSRVRLTTVLSVGQVMDIIPRLTRAALGESARRIMTAVKTRLAARGSNAAVDKATGDAIMRRVVEAAEKIGGLPEDTGPTLGREAAAIHQVFEDALHAWGRHLRTAHGEVTLSAIGGTRIAAGGWVAVQCQVSDRSGAPVHGVPVEWRVIAGPGRPKEDNEVLATAWSVSLPTGIVYLPVECLPDARAGHTIVIEAFAIGASRALRVDIAVG